MARFDAGDIRAGIDDPDVLASFRWLPEAEMALHLGAPAGLEDRGGAIRVRGAGGDFHADAVLAAMGRWPDIDGLGLETLGEPLDGHGMPTIDPFTQRIGDLPVFPAGDANGYRTLMHDATDDGHIAGRRTAPDDTGPGPCRRTPLSSVVGTPQIARTGPPLSTFDPDTIACGGADFTTQGRARIAQAAIGVLRVHADRATGRRLAAALCTPAAGHPAHLLGLAVARQIIAAEMLAVPF